MDDLISREHAVDHLKKRLCETALNNVGLRVPCDVIFADIADNRIEMWLNEIPSAEKTGKWLIPQRRGVMSWNEKAYAECSVCHEVIFNARPMKFCPNCGARMI